MTIRFLADVNFNQKAVDGLRRRLPGLDIMPHDEAGLDGLSDEDVIRTAARLGRMLLTHDLGIQIAQRRLQAADEASPGILIAGQTMPIGAR
jgi:hypothetical protein